MERARRIDPMKSSIHAGVVTIAHSDAPIAAIGDPLLVQNHSSGSGVQ
jgi:predicted amidohydrolase YtcJ